MGRRADRLARTAVLIGLAAAGLARGSLWRPTPDNAAAQAAVTRS